MLRFFCWKITILLLLSLQLHSDKNSEIYSFIDDNAQYFLTVIKEEGSNFEESGSRGIREEATEIYSDPVKKRSVFSRYD